MADDRMRQRYREWADGYSVTAVLRYNDTEYRVPVYTSENQTMQGLWFIWTDGNWGDDCNRAADIAAAYPDFPIEEFGADCSQMIELLRIEMAPTSG